MWRLPPKFQEKTWINFRENGALVGSCFASLGKKKRKCLKAARIFSFEAKRNRLLPNGEKLSDLQNAYIGFSTFFYFDPKNSKLLFFKNNCLQNSTFSRYLSNRNICYQLTYIQHAYTISKQYAYFWLCTGQKTGKGDDVTFETLFYCPTWK